MTEALASGRDRMGQSVREFEILRVAATFSADTSHENINEARRQVLAWTQRRVGGSLPKEAWNGKPFEHLSGGRTAIGTSFSARNAEFWALRADDPDKDVPGRNWTTEVIIGKTQEVSPRLSVRLIASTPEYHLDIIPHVPGFIQQLVQNCNITVGDRLLSDNAWRIASENDMEALKLLLSNPKRKRPVFVATGDERSDAPDQPLRARP